MASGKYIHLIDAYYISISTAQFFRILYKKSNSPPAAAQVEE